MGRGGGSNLIGRGRVVEFRLRHEAASGQAEDDVQAFDCVEVGFGYNL